MPGRSKNLLRNPRAKAGLNHWEVACSGGDGFNCEEEPAGCKKICECTRIKGNFPCWSTSHEQCEKFQLVYIPEYGISEERLDDKTPPITIRDWYCARCDCGCQYSLSVRLLADDKETELDSWKFDDTKEEGSDWTKIKHVFRGYPSGVRYVEFKHGGQDTKNWAGHFGAKMTNCGVFVGMKRSNKKKRAVRAKSGKNLLKNPCGMSGLDGWDIVSNGGDGFKVEEEPAGCKPIKEAYGDAEGESCWSTSHGDCEKKQLIDLSVEGIDSTYLDESQPQIKVGEWYGSRGDAGCKYWLKVRLLNSSMDEVSKREVKETKDAEGDWYQVEQCFSDYGPGVRFIEYSHGGRDTCSWGGNYGAKITCSFVAIIAEDQVSSSSSSSSSSSDEN